jgi:Flp pilus assembly pilin Flp
MVEYAIMVALIAVVCILVVTAVGTSVFAVFDETQKQLDTVKGVPKTAG